MNKQDNDFDRFMKKKASRKEKADADDSAAPPTEDDAFLSEFDSEYEVAAVVRNAQRTELARPGSPDEIPESMPVLRAFHEFLDQERRRSRRRMIILACSLTAGFLLLFLVGAVLLLQHQNQIADRYDRMAERLLTAREETARTGNTAEPTPSRTDDKTDSLKDMLLMSQQALINVQSKLDAQTTAQAREMGSLRQTLDRLAKEPSNDKPPVSEAASIATPTPPVAAQRNAAPGTTITIPITPAGSAQPITWRMALPE